MKIVYDKIGSNAKPFELTDDGVHIVGTLKKSGYHRLLLEADIDGNVELICDRCATEYTHNFDNKLRLTISDQLVEDKDNLDIIEFLDGVVDITYILKSEINALKGSYHYCDNCDNDDESFEVEF